MRRSAALLPAIVLSLNACVVGVEKRSGRAAVAAGPVARSDAGPSAARLVAEAEGVPVVPNDDSPRAAATRAERWVEGYHHWNGVRYEWRVGRLEARHASYLWRR